MADPFGFASAINWDAVDEHADEIDLILTHSPTCMARQHSDPAMCDEGCE